MGKGRQKTGLGSRRHDRETKLKAIEKVNAGVSMNAVAKEFGVRANVVKYWIEHADAILGPQGKLALTFEDGLDEYTRQRFHREGWGAVFEALRQSRRHFKDAPLGELTRFVEVLTERLSRLGAPPKKLNGDGGAPLLKGEQDKAIQEIEVMVARFTSKRDEQVADERQRAPRADDGPAGGERGGVVDVTPENQEPKDANGPESHPT